jgi:hypothetical protein
MSAITRNRELSQLGSFIYIDDVTKTIGIATDLTPNVGIGTTNATSKLSVVGNVNISGVVTASNFYGGFIGTATNAITANYATVSGLSTVAVGIETTSSVNTSGIITASAFYINDVLLINPEFSTWSYTGSAGISNTVYRLGDVGIGTSIGITEKLTVNGNVSANRFTSTVASGTAPFTVSSSTLVTNLNADFLRGKTSPLGDIVGTTDTQTITNKTLTSPIITSISNGGTVTLPSSTTTLIGRDTTDTLTNKSIAASGNAISGITNANLSGSAEITNANLANSTISGVSLGSSLASLSFSGFISATGSYNGSTAVSVSVAATTANTANSIVARNASGDFTAGTIAVTNLNASQTISASSFVGDGSQLTGISAGLSVIEDNATNDIFYPLLTQTSVGIATTSRVSTSKLTFNPSTGNFSATEFTSLSDETQKTNIKTVENSTEIIQSLRGVSFDWKETGKSSYGVIAQELEQILPDLVTTQQNKSVNYNGLVGVLIEAVKELSAEVEELKKKVS